MVMNIHTPLAKLREGTLRELAWQNPNLYIIGDANKVPNIMDAIRMQMK
jgi:hypothetical protein